MAALNFPSDPSTQTPVNTYSPDSTPLKSDNGVTYVWDGEKWTAATSSNYLPLSGGTLTGDLTVPSLNEGPLAGLRNQIIGGCFRVWQRGDATGTSLNASSTRYYLGPDRWFVAANDGPNRTVNVTQRDGSTIGGVDQAVRYGNFNTDASNYRVGQCIELNRQGNNSQFQRGSTWTFSIYSDKDLTSVTPAAAFVNSDTNLANHNQQVCTSTAFTALGDNRYASTITIDNDADTDSVSFMIRWSLAPGQADGRIDFAQAMLEPGPVATPFEHRPYGLELSLCQRYYQKSVIIGMVIDVGNSVTNRSTMTAPLATTMRVSANLSTSMDAIGTSSNASGSNASSLDIQRLNGYGGSGAAAVKIDFDRLNDTNNTHRRCRGALKSGDIHDWIDFDAEL